jgi:hypothetical protein
MAAPKRATSPMLASFLDRAALAVRVAAGGAVVVLADAGGVPLADMTLSRTWIKPLLVLGAVLALALACSATATGLR